MDSVNFDLIEGHKENIQPIRTGRSARALAEKLTPLSQNPHLEFDPSTPHDNRNGRKS
jgi:hypothetical protein